MWSLPFLLYLVGATLARLADEGARVALVLLAIEEGGGAGAGGLLVAAFLVPHVVAAPLLGRAIDRALRPLAVAALGVGVVAAVLGAGGLLVGRAPLALVAALLALRRLRRPGDDGRPVEPARSPRGA